MTSANSPTSPWTTAMSFISRLARPLRWRPLAFARAMNTAPMGSHTSARADASSDVAPITHRLACSARRDAERPSAARSDRQPRRRVLPAHVVQDKHRLRQLLLARLQTQKEDERRGKSAAIHTKLRRLSAVRNAHVVLCYVSLRQEVETWRLIEWLLKHGKRVVVPRVHGDGLQLSEIRDLTTDLAPGAFGVWEPTASHLRPVATDAVDLALVPGLAFDRSGYRLGRGGGFFDRFLPTLSPRTATIGLCFAFQLLDHLPTLAHDQRVQRVVSA